MRTLEASVVRLLQLWSDELPATIHRHEVFFGPPDPSRLVTGGRETLGGSHSTPTDMTGGSLLGSPAYSEPMRHLLEDDNPHREEPAIYEGSLTVEKHLVTPLRSAMRRCGRMMEAYLVEVARNGGDWYTPAKRRGCYSEDIARVYAQEAFRRLWREYQPVRPARIPRRKWTDLSESEQRSIEAGEKGEAA